MRSCQVIKEIVPVGGWHIPGEEREKPEVGVEGGGEPAPAPPLSDRDGNGMCHIRRVSFLLFFNLRTLWYPEPILMQEV